MIFLEQIRKPVEKKFITSISADLRLTMVQSGEK